MSQNQKRYVALIVLITFTFAAAGCGSILYPQRLREEPSNKLDAPVLLMDCLWLFVFIVPGVVALTVDFANRTVYYSKDELRSASGGKRALAVVIR